MRQRLRALARPFQHRDYRLYFAGQLLSFVGNWMQSAAQAWLVYRLTDAPVMLGLVAFAGQAPVFLLATIGGAIADRHGRQRVLWYAQWGGLAIAAGLALLTASGRISPPLILLFATLSGVLSAFEIPARQALLADLVGKKELLGAVAMNSALVNAARILGPVLAGLLIAASGEALCFALNGVSYLAMILALSRMQPRTPTPARGSFMAQALDGLRFALTTAPVRALLALLAVASIMGSPYLVLMPVFAREIFAGGPRTLGLLLGAAGSGALLGALVLASRDGVRGLGHWVVVAAAIFGVSLIAFSQARSLWLALALLPAVGFGMIVQMAATNTLIQVMAPDRLRARVLAVYSMTLLGMAPLGGLLAGALAHSLGARWTVSLGGAVCLVAAAVFHRRLPHLRAQAQAFIVAHGAASGEPPASSGVPVAAPRQPSTKP